MVKRCSVKEKGRLQEEFVNVYRHVWGSNAGLSTARIRKLSCKQLKDKIQSLKRFPAPVRKR